MMSIRNKTNKDIHNHNHHSRIIAIRRKRRRIINTRDEQNTDINTNNLRRTDYADKRDIDQQHKNTHNMIEKFKTNTNNIRKAEEQG